MKGYVRTALHYFQHNKPKLPQDLPYPWTQPIHEKNIRTQLEKAPAEELDENNQKRLQKNVGKFLYYARAIYPTSLMALNSLAAVQKKLTIAGYVGAALHDFQHEKLQLPQDSPYPWTQPIYGKNNPMLSEKAPAEELDENNQKRLQKTVGKFLYYARAIYPTSLMALNSMSAVQKKPTIDTAKQITQFLNYSATHPDAITEYKKKQNGYPHLL